MASRPDRVKAISGAPAPEGDCSVCPTPFKGLDVGPAGYHPDLKGTKWLKSAKLGKLRRCRQCSRLWVEHFDSREKYTWYADMGLNGVELLRHDTTPVILVNHAARATTERSRYWAREVARAWLVREPSWAPAIFEAVLSCLRLPVEHPNEIAAERRHSLVHIAATAIQQIAGGHRYPPNPDPEAVRQACSNYPTIPVSGVTFSGKIVS